ncbi:MAG: ATP-NAD kinase [Candidatus Tectomicrobia bacterium]|uniref:ATP-NAD kinase n=1 Tax=Tectimicrobiota bacterium TaxID=2528274 RepID=A0A937W1M6_UNCTE|nr:ATP-NAD kinase [Candidatus Tectomicrobia bacterium]
MACVGIIANPSSGKDIRRLVAHGSVFNNNEKVNIVRRVLLGLDATGVDTIVTMPDAFNICAKALDTLQLSATVCELDMIVESNQGDTIDAATQMRDLGVDCIVSLGGDGTNRVVAKACGSVPLLPLSTGTNNVFPYMFEGTLAGLAAGIVARGVLPAPGAIEQRPRLDIEVNGEVVDLALIDAVVCEDRYVASRAIWDITRVRMVVVAQRIPAQIGFMALAGNLPLDGAPATSGLVIETHPEAPTVLAPIAPGLIVPVGVKRHAPLTAGERVEVTGGPGTIALDGEREVVMRRHDQVAIRLQPTGPRVVNPQQVLALAAQHGFFVQGRT